MKLLLYLYILIKTDMNKNQQQKSELCVCTSTHKHELSFDEWVNMYKVSSLYKEPIKYFQGNNKNLPRYTNHESPLQKFFKLFTKH